MAVNLNVIDDIVRILDTLVADVDNAPHMLIDELLNSIYKLTYNIILSNLKDVPLINSNMKAVFTQNLKEGIMIEENDSRFTDIQYKIYRILFLIKLIDTESYAVLYKAL